MLKQFRSNIILKLCFYIFLLNIISMGTLYSSLHKGGECEYQLFYKQIIMIIVSWIILAFFSFINYRIYYRVAIFLYIITTILLIFVDFFGKTVMGAQRWLSFWGFSFQPSEFAKISAIFILAKFFSLPKKNDFLKIAITFILLGMNMILIFKQPDLGTATIILLLFLFVGFFSQIKKRYFILLIFALIAVTPFVWNILHEYQKKRLIVFLNPNLDPLGAGYTIIQSRIAIGSGKLFGKGFLSGTQNQFNFLPERHTDFIFTVIAEEWGFFGCLVLILLYWLILEKIINVALLLKDYFAFILTLGISVLIFLHIIINIGMTCGIFPVVGLPLLFISYGGSHLFVTYFLFGVFFNICRQHIL
ncbi:MAG: rod shape-determining protein RodA [Candidatus Omnitrophica bacterium]|nr:rod shape-determining protein RodA [Candidatus Omnitrophota bacterium]